MKKIALAFLMVMSSATALADGIYGGIGTEGFGIGYSQSINGAFNLRSEVNGLSKSYTQDSSDMRYAGDLKLGGVSVLGDYFPFAGNFRVTAGAIVNKGKLNGTAIGAGGTYTFNGNSYAASSNDRVDAEVKFGNVNPYLGIGFGHAPQVKGLGFYSDIGVIFQKPKSSITLSDGLAMRVSQADQDAERRSLQDSADKFKFYPVLKAGVSYTF